jgi:hypothetical protein
MTNPCPITKDPAKIRAKTADYTEFDCPVCGVFRISEAALALSGDNPETLAEALHVAKIAAHGGDVPLIDNVVSG